MGENVRLDDNFFLGKGLRLKDTNLWSLPVATENNCSLGFEVNFANIHEGLEYISFPRSIAIQFASTFVTSNGQRYFRIETKKYSDNPAQSGNEIWRSLDEKTLVFLLIRLMTTHYKREEYKEVIMDWSAKCAARAGLEKFDKKIGKLLYGFLSYYCSSQVLLIETIQFLETLNPSELEKFLWPSFVEVINSTNRKSCSLSIQALTEESPCCGYVLNSLCMIFVILQNNEANDQYALEYAQQLLQKQANYSPKLYVLRKSQILSQDFTSPFGISQRSEEHLGKELFFAFLLEDSNSEWKLGLNGFLHQVKERAAQEY